MDANAASFQSSFFRGKGNDFAQANGTDKRYWRNEGTLHIEVRTAYVYCIQHS